MCNITIYKIINVVTLHHGLDLFHTIYSAGCFFEWEFSYFLLLLLFSSILEKIVPVRCDNINVKRPFWVCSFSTPDYWLFFDTHVASVIPSAFFFDLLIIGPRICLRPVFRSQPWSSSPTRLSSHHFCECVHQ